MFRGTAKRDVSIESPPRVTVVVLVVLFSVLFLITELVLGYTACRLLGVAVKSFRDWIGGLVVFNLLLANLTVDRILRWHGLSRSGTTVEVWHRPETDAVPESTDEGRVDVHLHPRIFTQLGALCIVLCLIMVVITVMDLRHRGMALWGCFLIGVSGIGGLGAVGLFRRRARGKPEAWADASGYMGHTPGLSVRRKFVPWSEVASCTVKTCHDIWGKPIHTAVTLSDADGRSLVVSSFTSQMSEDPAPLVMAIRSHLPEPYLGLDDG